MGGVATSLFPVRLADLFNEVLKAGRLAGPALDIRFSVGQFFSRFWVSAFDCALCLQIHSRIMSECSNLVAVLIDSRSSQAGEVFVHSVVFRSGFLALSCFCRDLPILFWFTFSTKIHNFSRTDFPSTFVRCLPKDVWCKNREMSFYSLNIIHFANIRCHNIQLRPFFYYHWISNGL